MKKFLFLSIIFFTSCGKSDIPKDIDTYFNQFIDHFKQDADNHNVEYGDFDSITVIKFGFLQSSDLESECSFIKQRDFWDRTINYKRILFLPTLKNKDIQFQYQIFLHEVGHCAYHLSHNPDSLSIMYKIGIPISENIFPYALKIYFDDAEKNKQDWYSSTSLN